MTSSASRRPLPNRRPNRTETIQWAGSNGHVTTYTITTGFRLDGTPAEIFCDGAKIGSEMRLLLQDVAVIVSLALQFGIAPADLSRSLARVPVSKTESAPASIIGAICEVLMQGPDAEMTEEAL